MKNDELEKRHFVALRQKYNVGEYKSAASDRFLYLILRKAELRIQLTNLEIEWLAHKRLFMTIEIISLQQYQAEEQQRINAELLQLRQKFCIPEEFDLQLTSPVSSILWKLDCGERPTNSEIKILHNHGLLKTISLIQESLIFSKLKISYKATKHLGVFPEEPLYSILKKLDKKEKLTDSESSWLSEFDFQETLKFFLQQENEREAELEFLELKSKFKIDSNQYASASSPLYSILKKINVEQPLRLGECEWLKKENFNHLLMINQDHQDRKFLVELKERYKASQYLTKNSSGKLFFILKTLLFSELFGESKKSSLSEEYKTLFQDVKLTISEKDIKWLIDEELLETAEIAKVIHFKVLKAKYYIVGQLEVDPFYEIMLKLEREERLDPKQVVQLIEEDRLAEDGKIALAHYKLEAMFYEKEFQRTGNRWNLPSASKNWRKANEPKNALKITEKANWNKVKESDLKSALWVTRGAAFRDLHRLDEAKTCATQAMECQPESHQPYTLLGAICYDQGEYAQGDLWFGMAVERGANDTDDEIERIVRMTKDKDKRKDVVEYLLQKDPQQYSWAKSYLK